MSISLVIAWIIAPAIGALILAALAWRHFGKKDPAPGLTESTESDTIGEDEDRDREKVAALGAETFFLTRRW